MLAEQPHEIITRGVPVSIVPRAEETATDSLVRQLEAYRAINTLVDMLFVEGEDYGIQPGTDQYALRIPGIEKACSLLGLREEYHDIEVVRDYSPTAPFFYYEVECRMYSIVTGQEVVRGQGVCHTREKGFMRQGKRKCPKCGAEAVNRSKNAGEGWYCWRKENGCGATFAEKDPAIISQEVGNVVDPQLVWDNINRTRKVANKRAASSAIRRIAMLSGHFIKRPGNGSTDIRYTPAEIKALTATRTTAIIPGTTTGIPTTEQSAVSMGSGGSRRVEAPKPEIVASPTPAVTTAPVTPPAQEEEIVIPPDWYTEAKRAYILSRLKEEDKLLVAGQTWGDLLAMLGWKAEDCYGFKSGNDMYQAAKPILIAKKQMAAAQSSSTPDEPASTIQQHESGNPIITAPDSPFAQPANPTPALSNSAFNRGLDNYQAQQAAAQVDTMNAELDSLFAQTMERDVTP